jgi:dipeptidyl aminopeptidase/acylaminoacyl peptidase
VRWVDHQTLALLKRAGEAGFQIYLFERLAGTGQQITDHPGGIETFEPFGNGFLYTARKTPDELASREGRYGNFKIAGEQESISALYYVDRERALDYRRNSGRSRGEGSRQTKPFIELSRLLEKPVEIESVIPSPGSNSVFLNCRSNEDEFCREVTDCFRIEFDPDSIFRNQGDPAPSGRVTRLALPKGAQVKAISPDGTGMLVLHKEGGPGGHIQSDLWMLDLTLPRQILEHADLKSYLKCLTKSLDQEPLTATWTRQGIFLSYWNKSRCEIARISKDGAIEVWETQDLSPEVFVLNEDAQICMRAASATRLAEIYYGSPASKGWDLKRITSFNEQYSGWDFGTAETVHWTSKDGTEIEGILRKPSNFDPGRKYPLVFNIHGGPAAVSPLILLDNNNRYFYPTVQFLNKDILILEPNYRGSLGRGQEFLALNFDQLGVGDLWDIESAIDHLVAQGFVDETRIGCMGWSQGGYISAFAAMHSNRLKAASAGAALSDWRIYRAGSDEPQSILLSGDPFSNKAWFDRSAPISAVHQAQTPILFQHGEKDPRVPLISAMEMYRALKARGVPTTLVVFPGQGHGFLKPRECHALMLQNYRWFMHHLLGEELDLLMDDSDETDQLPVR